MNGSGRLGVLAPDLVQLRWKCSGGRSASTRLLCPGRFGARTAEIIQLPVLTRWEYSGCHSVSDRFWYSRREFGLVKMFGRSFCEWQLVHSPSVWSDENVRG